MGFIPPEVDVSEGGLVEPLGKIMSQLVGGGGAAKVRWGACCLCFCFCICT